MDDGIKLYISVAPIWTSLNNRALSENYEYNA
jgi:hypothetical protein